MGNQQSKAVLLVTGFLGLSLIWVNLQDAEDFQGGGGIINLGNTCFLNALLQAFASSQAFVAYIQSLCCYVVQDTPQHDFAIVQSLKQAVETLRSGKTHLRPEDLVSHLTHKFPYFGQQQDSHEVYLVLHDALTRVRAQPSLRSLLTSPEGVDPMLGLMTNTVTCLHCSNQTESLQPFSYLYLDWKPDLSSALQAMCDGETVEYECLKCSVARTTQELQRQLSVSEEKAGSLFEKETERSRIHSLMASMSRAAATEDSSEAGFLVRSKYVAQLTHTVVRLPQVLCILVKRLIYSSAGYLTKVQNHLTFPIELTTDSGLQALGISNDREKYELSALIEHSGTALGGHYFTYKRTAEDWLYVSDTAVHKVDIRAVQRGQAYMLFYEKVGK